MKPRLAPAMAAVLLALAACSSSSPKSAGAPAPAPADSTSPTATADSPAPAANTASTPTTAPQNADAECGQFDDGANYLSQAYARIIAGKPMLDYGIELSRTSDAWQGILNHAAPGDSLAADIKTAKDAENDLWNTILDGNKTPGGAPIEIGPQVRTLKAAFDRVGTDCDSAGYRLTQHFGQ